MKRFICVLITLALFLSLSSCSNGGSGKNIVYPIEVSPNTLDPQYASDTGALLIINNIFEGLVRYDVNGKIIPGIANEWTTSQDGLTWTFTLQNGTEWYCPASIKNEFGEEFYTKFTEEKVTANDFVFACQRTVDPAINSPHANRMLIIENAYEVISGQMDLNALGVTAPDENTIVFKLTEPCANFLDRLTESEFMPCNKEFYETMKGRYGINAKHILCNGPFYVSNWDPESTMTCKANKYYAGSQPVLPASVIFAFANDNASVLSKLSTGNISCALLPPESELPENVKVEKELNDSVYGFMFNCKDEYLINYYLRKAMCLSIDVNLFNKDLNSYVGLIPPVCLAGSRNYYEATKKHTEATTFNEKTAIKNWEIAYETLGSEQIELSVLCPPEFESALRQQFQIWQKLFGINFAISLTVMPSAEILTAMNNGEFQIAISGIHSTTTDAVSYISQFRDGGVLNYRSTKFMEIIDSLSDADTEDDIIIGCYEAESFLLRQAVCFPIYTKASHFVVSENVGDVSILGTEKTISFINAKRFD